jgi:CHAT domain-containing protein
LPTAKWRPGIIAAGAAAIVIAGASLLRHELAAQSELEALARAAAHTPFRSIPGRLAGFAYRPLPAITRGADAVDRQRLPLLAAAANVLAQSDNAAPEHLHAVAVSYVLVGKPREAVAAFERAVIIDTGAANAVEALHATSNAELLSDLSAAFLSNATTEATKIDALRALDAAERAWAFEKSPAIAWNRALALDFLHLREDAREAWSDYLSVEPDSSWRAEAAKMVVRLNEPTAWQRWTGIRQKMLAERSAHDVAEAAQCCPQQLHTFLEEELLARWGRASAAGHAADAAALLAIARSAAAALAQSHHDAMNRDAVDALIAADSTTVSKAARAFAAYGDGIEAYRSGDYARARPALAAARQSLEDIASPAAAITALRLASCDFYDNRHDAVGTAIESMRRTYATYFERYPSWAGQLEWLAGLEALVRGDADESYACYSRALAHFERVGELENVGAIHELMAENRNSVGATEEMWQHQLAALDLLGAAGSWRRGTYSLSALAETATTAGANNAARRLISRLIEHATRNGNAEMAAYGCLWRAVVNARAGAADNVRRDLAAVRGSARRIASGSVRERLDADVAVIEAEVGWSNDGDIARRLDSAIAFYRKANHDLLLAQALIVRGRRSADRAAAIADFREGLEIAERNGDSIADSWQRATFFGSFDSAAERLVDLLLKGGDTVSALSTADANRGRVLSQLVAHGLARPGAMYRPELDPRALAATLPPGVAVIEVATRERETVAWVVTRGHIALQPLSLPRETLGAAVRRFRAEIYDASPHWRETGAQFYDQLLRPLEPALRQSARLIIVPDAELENLPFAALYDRVNEQFLVERFEVDVAPTATLLRKRVRGTATNMAAFGDPAFDRIAFPRLAALPGARGEASTVAERYVRGTIRVGADATKSAFVEALGRSDVIHFGGHGIAASDHPWASRLVLAPDRGNDGALHASEIVGTRVRAGAVVLSACSMGLSAERWSNGASSLSKAFVGAGAGAVAAPLWDIDDSAAQPFFCAIHDGLAKGLRLGAAARAAQIVAIRTGRAPASIWASLQVIDRELE